MNDIIYELQQKSILTTDDAQNLYMLNLMKFNCQSLKILKIM